MFDVRRTAQKEGSAISVGEGAERPAEITEKEETERRHKALMDLLEDEGRLQAEERIQMAIDEDYYDHLHWRPEDAEVLIERGQAPVVFNEARQSIDWIIGTEKRMRKDYKVLPREEGDEDAAEVKTKVIKYTDDVNMTQHQRSQAFGQTAKAGLSWLEEGVNPDPEDELIYSGIEDWRNVFRDSRSRKPDMDDARYLFRRKVTDLDYAIALLPKQAEYLRNGARAYGENDGDTDIWYLGERLTNASEGDWLDSSSRFGDRAAYVKRDGFYDSGRRQSVELLECWYRVPESVDVFADGDLRGKVMDIKNPEHVAAKKAGARLYSTVKMRMRVMIATKEICLWDGPSPFKHQKFLLVPIWGYRRARDGQVYGPMRGMRDIQDDLNKRRSKALFALSTNRIIMDKGAVEDIEELRDEAARPDGIIEKAANKKLEFQKNTHDFQGNLLLAQEDSQLLRNAGGVTNENLGRNTQAQSGIAIERKQDQGSLTTSGLFDNYMLAIKLAGQLRLSHIEQFYTQAKAVRILGEDKPVEWLKINQVDPLTGQMLNDITATQADFIVDTQDYRASLAQAALDQMFELLGKIATFAPQVVLSVLDLLVESADIKNKDEWVTRIRKVNGQRDPTKKPTPEEMQAEQAGQAKQAAREALDERMLIAKVDETEAKAKLLNADEVLRRVNTMFEALQAAQVLATAPGVAGAADAITKSAGMVDEQPGPIPAPEAMPAPEVLPVVPPDQAALPAPIAADPAAVI
ncbi:hypothetical protein [Polaromonas sp.]|uniref:portal protein n=1 Tax=Polaromonas sp. TaxID=1869339 RepID=UPI0032674786